MLTFGLFANFGKQIFFFSFRVNKSKTKKSSRKGSNAFSSQTKKHAMNRIYTTNLNIIKV